MTQRLDRRNFYRRETFDTMQRRATMLLKIVLNVSCVTALIFLPSAALAGGPKYVAGTTYFNSGTAGVPLTWSQGSVNYYTDRGNLSPILPGATADALVADAWSQWTSMPTVAVSAVRAGQLAEDVSGTNVTVNSEAALISQPTLCPLP